MEVRVEGTPPPGVTAKDIILGIIGRIGIDGGVGHVIEYTGEAIRALSMEGRLTLCNLSIEAGARCGMVAPDETTINYLRGRPFAPKEEDFERAAEDWLRLRSDEDAQFDREIVLDASEIAPVVTWGVSPEDALPITAAVPDPGEAPDAEGRAAMARTLDYMGLRPGTRLEEVAVDRVFIGSCTNSRIEDLRGAAAVARGRKVAEGVRAWVVPGSEPVKRQAEAEGLHELFRSAGFEWRQPGCSMCVGTNGDIAAPGVRVASTSNRNFMGRQGPGARTHLLSPAMAAAAAVTGRFTDVRKLGGEGG